MARARKKPVTVADLTARQATKEAVEEAEEFMAAQKAKSPKRPAARAAKRAGEAPPASAGRPASGAFDREGATSAYRFVADNWHASAGNPESRRFHVVKLAKRAAQAASDARRFYAERGAVGSARWLAGRGVVWLLRRLS